VIAMSKLIVAALLALPVVGCGSASDPQTFTMVAATSLKPAAEAMIAEYEAAHPGTKIEARFAPSDQIERQLEAGLKADAVATANEQYIRDLEKAGFIEDSKPFASNRMVIAVGNDSRSTVGSPEELADGARIAVGDADVPVGRYANEIITALGEHHGESWRSKVEQNIVTRADSAANVIAPVAMGGVDASLSYLTDVKANADRVTAIEIPETFQPRIEYWIGGAKSSIAGAALVEFITSQRGVDALAEKGFPPVSAAVGSEP
jgi:molybdate transport system substrate-binding protein